MQGVYAITNLTNGVRYVGSSKSISHRLAQHLAMLKKNIHHSIYLQRAWNKYGEKSFTFRPLAILEDSEVLPTEQRLLDLEHTGETYNVSKDAVAWMKGRKHTEEWVEKSKVWKLGNKSRTGVASHWSKDKLPPSLYKLIASCKNPSEATRLKMREAKMARTHCVNGHEMTEENTETADFKNRGSVTRRCKKCYIANISRANNRKRNARKLKGIENGC